MPVFKNLSLPSGIDATPMTYNMTIGSSTLLSSIIVLVNGPSSTADPSVSSDSPSNPFLTRFTDPDLESGGWLFYKAKEGEAGTKEGEYTALHMAAVVLIGLGKDEGTGKERVWLQVSISEEVSKVFWGAARAPKGDGGAYRGV